MDDNRDSDKPEDRSDTALEHAWNWFAMHAAQRMQGVNFFLVSIAFLSTGYVQAVNSGKYSVAAGVALLATVVAYSFYKIERRCRNLVRVGDAAMRKAEEKLAADVDDPALRMLDEVEVPKPGDWSYGRGLGILYRVVMGSAFVGFVYAVWHRLSGTAGPVAALEYRCSVAILCSLLVLWAGYVMLDQSRASAATAAPDHISHWIYRILGALGVLTGLAGFAAGAYCIIWG